MTYEKIKSAKSSSELKELDLNLVLDYVKSHVNHIHGPKNIQLKESDVLVICRVLNGEEYIEEFVNHYLHKIGVKHIYLLDTGSTDRTIELACTYDNISVLKTELPFNIFRFFFIKYLAYEYGKGDWILQVDIDEFFDFPLSEFIDFKSFIEYLDRNKFEAVITQMLDMFPDYPIMQLESAELTSFRSDHVYYDLSEVKKRVYEHWLRLNQYADPEIKFFTNGVRYTNFALQKELWLSKMSLFKFLPHVDLIHNHYLKGAYIADISAVLFHYKFRKDLSSYVQDIISDQLFGNHTIDYELYNLVLERYPEINFYTDRAKKLQNTSQLIYDEFLDVSFNYLQWVLSNMKTEERNHEAIDHLLYKSRKVEKEVINERNLLEEGKFEIKNIRTKSKNTRIKFNREKEILNKRINAIKSSWSWKIGNFVPSLISPLIRRKNKTRAELLYEKKADLSSSNVEIQINQDLLKELLFEIIDLFVNNKILYWIDHGTLLGCLRDGKIIPWDDDADMSCLYEDQNKIRSLLNNWTRPIEEIGNHIKVYYEEGEESHVDVFFYKELLPGILCMTYGFETHIPFEDIRNIKKYQFYNKAVNIPDNAEIYLERKWGKTWMTRHDKYLSGRSRQYYDHHMVLKNDFKESRLLGYSLHYEDGEYYMERPQEIANQYFSFYNIEKERDQALFKLNGRYAKHINKKIIWTNKEEASKFILGERNRLSILKSENNFWPEHKITLVMAAAGKGNRINGEKPKQFLLVNGKPIIYYTLKIFEEIQRIDEIIIGVRQGQIEYVKKLIDTFQFKKCRLVVGGATRRETIHQCIQTIAETDIVIIHDAVRPLVKEKDIYELLKYAPYYDIVSYCTPLKGGLSKINSDNFTEDPIRRNHYMETHCPFTISYNYIKENPEYRYNIPKNCKLIETHSNSIFKITYPHDLAYFQSLIEKQDH